MTWQEYETDLEDRLADLHSRVHRGTYRAQPSKRVYIPKADGRQRPLGIAALEDKIVQQAVVTVLNQIYEEDFLGFSYGFRPGRSQHRCAGRAVGGDHAEESELGARCRHSWLFRQYDHEWLMKFVEHRVADRRILRLIQKWLKAGVSEDGTVVGDRRWVRRKGQWFHRCLPTSTCTMSSICGSRHWRQE